MASSSHFLFEIFKIAVLAAAYAGALFLLLLVIFRIAKFDLKKIKFSALYRIVAVLLFVFMFTYYGDHGLGDESRIPIGNWEVIRAGDGYPYFTPTGKTEQIRLSTFALENDFLVADTDTGFIAFDLSGKRQESFASRESYNLFASKAGLPLASEFEDFYTHYNRYWSGWRFWLLP